MVVAWQLGVEKNVARCPDSLRLLIYPVLKDKSISTVYGVHDTVATREKGCGFCTLRTRTENEAIISPSVFIRSGLGLDKVRRGYVKLKKNGMSKTTLPVLW